ncbi:MAG: hypothetical protein AAFX40_09810, partial [Cyanobacteria bacterium J06639_1]
MVIQPSKSRINVLTGGLVGAIVSAAVFGTTAPPALAQRILNPNPAQGAQSVGTQPAISASFEALNGVDVQPDTMRVLLDGEDVSDRAVINSDFFSYRPSSPLAPGSHQIVLEYENTRGVPQRASWNFNVSSPSRTAIDSVTHNGNNRPLGSGEVLLATVTGTPNSDVVLYLVQDGQRVQTLTTEEVSSGTYVANVLVEAKDATREGILVSRLE